MSTTLTLDSIILHNGAHGPTFCGEACAVEVANLIAAGLVIAPPELLRCDRPLEPAPFGDYHPSISPVIRRFVIGLNDAWNDEDRQRLRPYTARILCTRTTAEDEETRAWMATDWLARVHTPAFLRLAGLEEHARALEGLARIADATMAGAAQPTLNDARSAASAARDAARAAAWDAAWDAARDAAWDAAWDAARDAARAAAWDAAGAAARAAARAAAWDAAGAAARAAAWDAARDAARDAAWDAAWDAARDALRPTVEQIQSSALALLDEMIEVGRTAVQP